MKKCFYNGKIKSLNQNNEEFQAMLVEDTLIKFLGTNEEILNLCDNSVKKYNLENRLVLPGFIDNHTHFVQGGLSLLSINLKGCKSKEEFISRIRDYVAEHKGEWVIGGEWNQYEWSKPEMPDREWIDSFSEDTPIFLMRMDGHLGLANSLALKLADINQGTQAPEGGLIEKRESGELTGILKDNAMQLVQKVIPQYSKEKLRKALELALNEAKVNGITSINDISSLEDYYLFEEFNKEKSLSCRIYSRLPIKDFRKYYEEGLKLGKGDLFLKTGSLKAFADGSLGSQTAWFFDPYVGTDYYGLPMDILENGELREWAIEADRLGYNLSIHAIGDRAIYEVLKIFEEIKSVNPPWDRRFRIEHAQHINPEILEKLYSLDVIVSAQPYHLYDDGEWAEDFIGSERIKSTYAFKSFLNKNIKLCFGSDWTVAPLNALLGIYAAVTRQTAKGRFPNGWVPDEKISVQEAVLCYTKMNAYAEYSENLKGTLEQGKLADFVVLDKDIYEIEKEEIKDTKILMTIFNGEIIFEK